MMCNYMQEQTLLGIKYADTFIPLYFVQDEGGKVVCIYRQDVYSAW